MTGCSRSTENELGTTRSSCRMLVARFTVTWDTLYIWKAIRGREGKVEGVGKAKRRYFLVLVLEGSTY
jgi:hypothetical protein